MHLATSRFNRQTWLENSNYREKKGIKGCIYCCPSPVSTKIDPNIPFFVIEMNNDLNKIEGIGLLYNKIEYDKYYCVYDTKNYNRYTYRGNYRLDRIELYRYNPIIVEALDYILFKEKTHMKRGSGIKLIPDKLLKHPICDNIDIKKELKATFKKHFSR
jgi:hypothetical protein